MQKIGIVAASAHQIGNVKSATSPRAKKTIQKIFRCIGLGSGGPGFSIAPFARHMGGIASGKIRHPVLRFAGKTA